MIDYPIYCLNLRKEIDRRKVIENQFKKYKMEYTFCDAIDANKLIFTKNNLNSTEEEREGYYFIDKNNKFNFHIKSKEYYQKIRKDGHLGCSLSHLYYINMAYTNNLKTIVMCEDDISFEYMGKWKRSISGIIKNAPNNWKIIKLHCSNIIIMKKYIKKEEYVNIPKDSVKFWSTGIYLINIDGMKDILNKYYNDSLNKFELFVDFPVADYLLHQIEGVYYYTIPLVKNNNLDYSFKSDVAYSDMLTIQEEKGIKFVEKFYR